MHTTIKVPYGYNSMSIDNMLSIFSGKIRVKYPADRMSEEFISRYTITQGRKDCVIIQYVTTSWEEHVSNMKHIDMFLANIMTTRIVDKYIGKYMEPVTTDDLPF